MIQQQKPESGLHASSCYLSLHADTAQSLRARLWRLHQYIGLDKKEVLVCVHGKSYNV